MQPVYDPDTETVTMGKSAYTALVKLAWYYDIVDMAGVRSWEGYLDADWKEGKAEMEAYLRGMGIES